MAKKKPLDLSQAREYCIGRFLRHEDFAFAIALNLASNHELAALYRDDVILHAGVVSKSGLYYDARGTLTELKFCSPFTATAPYTIKKIAEIALYACESQKIRAESIKKAGELIAQLYPELNKTGYLSEPTVEDLFLHF